jgi:hypothetical protein
LWKTVNNGTPWVSVSGNLVDSPINVVVQDRRNANLLIVGNDRGVWVSIDGGSRWERLKANLPTVPVHDLTIHPRENDLALGTYGRGIFLADITHLQELSADVLAKPFTCSMSNLGLRTTSALLGTIICSGTPTSRCRTNRMRSSSTIHCEPGTRRARV